MTLLFSALLLLTFGTAMLSAITGMIGGVILMGVLASLFSVTQAMVVHGFIQFASNSTRAWLLRRNIHWAACGRVSAGALLGAGLFALLAIAPARWLVLLALGLMPWIGYGLARSQWALDILKPPHAYACGILNSLASLLSGVSGPTQDIFFTHTKMTRHQVVASKAAIQAIGHGLKMAYYGGFLWLILAHANNPFANLPIWFLPLALLLTWAGTRTGTRLLNRLSDTQFFRLTRVLVLSVGTLILLRAILEFAPS